MNGMSLKEEITKLHADFCYALTDANRLLIIYALSNEPKCVSEIAQELEISQPSVSRNLKILKDRGCVRATRRGTSKYFELTDLRLVEALDILRAMMRDQLTHKAEMFESTATKE